MVAPAHDEIAAAAASVVSPPGSPAAKVVDRVGAAPSISARPTGSLYPPASSKGIDFMAGETEWQENMGQGDMVLELADGLALCGHSFGADKSISGECVFQTGEFLMLACTWWVTDAQAWSATPSRLPTLRTSPRSSS